MSNTMDCQEVARRLDEYAASELSAQERGEVDEHLRGCADCRAALSGLRSLDARVRALPVRALPDDFLAQVYAKLAKERPGTGPALHRSLGLAQRCGDDRPLRCVPALCAHRRLTRS